jgi:outer membrane lipoprotein SlyB
MWWALPIATALMGASKADRQAKQQKEYNLAQAEATRYSPWTGRAGQLDNSATANAFEGAVSGGVHGLGIAQGLGWGPGAAAAGSNAATGDAVAGGKLSLMDKSQYPSVYGGEEQPWWQLSSGIFGNNKGPR